LLKFRQRCQAERREGFKPPLFRVAMISHINSFRKNHGKICPNYIFLSLSAMLNQSSVFDLHARPRLMFD
jgi:hypothetical protein